MPKKQKWIPVSEGLPETDELVLFVENGNVTVGNYAASASEENCWWDCISTDMSGSASYTKESDVTHWMPLPDPPKN